MALGLQLLACLALELDGKLPEDRALPHSPVFASLAMTMTSVGALKTCFGVSTLVPASGQYC